MREEALELHRRDASSVPGNATLVAWMGLAVVYLAIGLFIYPDWINIGMIHGVEEVDEVRIFGMPPPDIAFVLILGFAFATNLEFRLAVLGRTGLLCLGLLAAYLFLGLAWRNDLSWIREDVRIWLWGFAGLGIFHLIMKARHPCLHILAATLLAGAVLFLSADAARGTMDNNAYLGNTRVWDLNVFNYSGMMILLLGLTLSLCALKNIFYLGGALAALGVFFYSAVMVSATRSLALALLAVCAFALPSLLFKRNREIIGLRVGGKAVWIAALVGLAVVLVAATFLGLAFTGSTVMADRWNAEDIDSGVDRFVELSDAIRQLGLVKGLTGGGLGFAFESIFDYTSITLHIGVFGFLLKFGILPFLAIAGFFYGILPVKFVQAILFPRSLHPFMRTALLVTLPGLLGWALILSMSGGYDHYYFIGAGISLGVFAEVRRRGLGRICR